jgi:cytoplasmic iron level regulating protein YaaA (DUF328/UPF0246 family)
VLVLLPPSETKAPGGDGSPLRLDTLSHPELTPTRRRSAGGGSALFGLLAADDPVPAYRLSASSSLPGVGTVRSVWRPVLPPLLTRVAGLVVDLRSSAYAALAPRQDAVTIRVLCADSDGRRRPARELPACG